MNFSLYLSLLGSQPLPCYPLCCPLAIKAYAASMAQHACRREKRVEFGDGRPDFGGRKPKTGGTWPSRSRGTKCDGSRHFEEGENGDAEEAMDGGARDSATRKNMTSIPVAYGEKTSKDVSCESARAFAGTMDVPSKQVL